MRLLSLSLLGVGRHLSLVIGQMQLHLTNDFGREIPLLLTGVLEKMTDTKKGSCPQLRPWKMKNMSDVVGRSNWTEYSASKLSFAAYEVYSDKIEISGIGTDNTYIFCKP